MAGTSPPRLREVIRNGCGPRQNKIRAGKCADLSRMAARMTEGEQPVYLLASGRFRYFQPTLRSFSRLAGVFPDREAAAASANA